MWFEASIIASQILQLLDYYLLMNSIDQVLDGIHSKKRMVFFESMHEGCCYMQTQLVVDM